MCSMFMSGNPMLLQVFLYQISSSTYFCLANSFLDGCPFGSAQVVHRSFLTWQTRWSGQLRWRPKTSSSSSMGSLGCTPRRLICWGSHTGWLWCHGDTDGYCVHIMIYNDIYIYIYMYVYIYVYIYMNIYIYVYIYEYIYIYICIYIY